MKNMTEKELIFALSAAFGPSGCEDNAAALIEAALPEACEIRRDRMGNVIAHLPGDGARVMLTSHMDEVGLMITSIDDNGYLRFSPVGQIDPRVLCGRAVTVGNEEKQTPGVIGAKPIHLQSAEERGKVTACDAMYIDIGAENAEEAKKYADIGDYAVFSPTSAAFGSSERRLRGKGLDGRLGCAALIETMRAAAEKTPACDLWAVFSVREEIGRSGAGAAAYAIRPDYIVVLGTAEVYDLPDGRKNAGLGGGILLSAADKGTIYDAALMARVRTLSEEMKIPVGIYPRSAAPNGAAAAQRAAEGAVALALSLPVRYAHSASTVADIGDYRALCSLLPALLAREDSFPVPKTFEK